MERNATVEIKRVGQLTRDALSNMERPIAAAGVSCYWIIGASYKEDVGDTRNSGSEIIIRTYTDINYRVNLTSTPR